MFDDIAKRYDILNHLLSLGQDFYWRHRMTRELGIKAAERVLDLAAGTGDSSLGFLKTGAHVVGLDLSYNMLKVAQKKIAHPAFHVMQGSAYAMPFLDASFDGLTCAFGIRNMHETPQALSEIFRVIKPGGRVVILEFSMPDGWFSPVYRFYLKNAVPGVAALFSERSAYEYLGDSIGKFYTPAAFRKLMEEAGFINCRQTPLSLGTVYVHRAERPR
ncbi:MAG TPA: ubiquinone/menaquinone biosynthesis methyltransferase [Dissulfurispiraceae bacterium]|nr:ubiquinone/menaquinone biosynthesis methyltransferase [Dissulfurispiraceae bacterium]